MVPWEVHVPLPIKLYSGLFYLLPYMLKKFDWDNFSLDDFKAKLVNYCACPKGWYEVENTLCPPQIIITKKEILHLVFLGTCGHHILDYFCSFQVYCNNFKVKPVYLKRSSNKKL
jgi:hypothetical protein